MGGSAYDYEAKCDKAMRSLSEEVGYEALLFVSNFIKYYDPINGGGYGGERYSSFPSKSVFLRIREVSFDACILNAGL